MTQKKRTELYRTAHVWNAVLNWLLSALTAAAILFVLFFVWMRPVRIDGDSMLPLLEEQQILLIDRANKYVSRPGRGAIVAFRDPVSGSVLVKRIVGMPGEQVKIQDGCVYVNDLPLVESYAVNPEEMNHMAEITVPEGHVFVLSDNREVIYDSRSINIGCVSYKDITGVIKLRVFPFRKISFFI